MIDLKGKGKQNDSGSAAAASTAGPANASGSSSTKQATTVAEDDDDDLDELDDVLEYATLISSSSYKYTNVLLSLQPIQRCSSLHARYA